MGKNGKGAALRVLLQINLKEGSTVKDKIVFKLSLIMCLIIHCSNIKCLYISYASGKKKYCCWNSTFS